MIVLGLDTATSATVVGVLGADGVVHEARDDPAPGARPAHAARLLGAVDEALDAAGVGWDEVTRLAVGVGPGSFTGLRIGIATARGLAQARGLEVVGVSTLEALARGADAESVLAVLDARRGEAFAAAFGPGAFAPVAIAPEVLAEKVRAMPVAPLAVGDGAVRFGAPSRRPERRSRPTRTASIASAPDRSASSVRRGEQPTATHSYPTTAIDRSD